MWLQAEQLPGRVYTVADGLASDDVSCIVQDSHGFIWFCTSEGLSRFDGYRFQSFGTEQGLHGRVSALLETSSDGVYNLNPWQVSPFTLYRLGGHGAGPRNGRRRWDLVRNRSLPLSSRAGAERRILIGCQSMEISPGGRWHADKLG